MGVKRQLQRAQSKRRDRLHRRIDAIGGRLGVDVTDAATYLRNAALNLPIDAAEREVTQTEQALRSRHCGECSLCCTVMRVDDIAKPANTACSHLCASGGCGIYASRPMQCRVYQCGWRWGITPEECRPDLAEAVVDWLDSVLVAGERDARMWKPGLEGPRFSYYVIRELRPGVHKTNALLREFIAWCLDQPLPAMVVSEAGAPGMWVSPAEVAGTFAMGESGRDGDRDTTPAREMQR